MLFISFPFIQSRTLARAGFVIWGLKSPASRVLTQPFIQAQMKENTKLRVTGLCAGNSPVTGEFLAQRTSDADFFHLVAIIFERV